MTSGWGLGTGDVGGHDGRAGAKEVDVTRKEGLMSGEAHAGSREARKGAGRWPVLSGCEAEPWGGGGVRQGLTQLSGGLITGA